jgi:hypothetical protein
MINKKQSLITIIILTVPLLIGAFLIFTPIGQVIARGLGQLPQHGWTICEDLGMGYEPGMPEERQMFKLCHSNGWELLAYCLDPNVDPPGVGRYCSMLNDDVFWCGDDVQELHRLYPLQTPTDPPVDPDTPTSTPSFTNTTTHTSTYTNTPTQTQTQDPTSTSTNTPTETATFTVTYTPYRVTDIILVTPTETRKATVLPDPTQTLEDPPVDPSPTRTWSGGATNQDVGLYLILLSIGMLLVISLGVIIILRKISTNEKR